MRLQRAIGRWIPRPKKVRWFSWQIFCAKRRLRLKIERAECCPAVGAILQRIRALFGGNQTALLPSVTAKPNKTTSCMVNALVETTPISAPARVYSTNSLSRGRADSITLPRWTGCVCVPKAARLFQGLPWCQSFTRLGNG